MRFSSVWVFVRFRLGCEREQGRFKQAREGAARRSKGSSKGEEGSSDGAQEAVLAPGYNCPVVCFSQEAV